MTTRQEALRGLYDTLRAMTWQSYRQGVESLERLGITMPQAVLLLALEAQQGRATMRQLAELTTHAGATLTGITDRLVDAGLVTRERDDDDRRVVYVCLSQAGRAKIEQINAQREADIEQMTGCFSDEEIVQFVGLVRKFMQQTKI